MFKEGSDAKQRQTKMFRNAVRMFLESSSHPTYVQKLKSLPVHKAVEMAQYQVFLEQFLETIRQYDALCKPGSKVEKVWVGIQVKLQPEYPDLNFELSPKTGVIPLNFFTLPNACHSAA